MVVLDGMLLENAVIGVSRVLYPDGMPMCGKRKCVKIAVNGVFHSASPDGML